MRQRIYRLMAKSTGEFEIVPGGWSFLAAGLGPIWAIANGLFARYFLLMVPLVPIGMLSAWWPEVAGAMGVLYIVVVLIGYFPVKAFSWRKRLLESRGYEMRAELVATSSREALRIYAEAQR